MKLYVDLETLQLIEGPGFRNPVSALRFKRGDAAKLEVAFLQNATTAVEIGDPATLALQFGIKPHNRYDVDYLVHESIWAIPAQGTEDPSYLCSPSFNTQELDSAMQVGSATGSELSEITLMGEITWREGSGDSTSTRTFTVVVENDVNRGTEGVPSSADPPYPLPAEIVTHLQLPDRAVMHDAVQALDAGEQQQARDNIGASPVITDSFLTIARTAGLQAALDGKLGYKLNTEPADLDPVDQNLPWFLEKDGGLWLYDPVSGAVELIKASPPGALVIQESVSGLSINPSPALEVPAGDYLVTVSVANFTTSSWGSHQLQLVSAGGNGTFSLPTPGSLMDLYPDMADAWATFFLHEPFSAANPQEGTAHYTSTATDSFNILGYRCASGDSADITITFTPTTP